MTIYIRLDMDGQFYVEHLVNASRMAKHELSANDTCALKEDKLKAQLELSEAGNMQINISKNKGG